MQGFWRESWVTSGLRGLFLVNGASLMLLAIIAIIQLFKSVLLHNINNYLNEITISYWLISGALFMVFFAPSMATRHVLMILPPLMLILGSRFLTKAPKILPAISLVFTCFLTLALGISDWQFADYYRRQAQGLKESLPPGNTVWFTGHWGWQWYAKQNGFQQLSSKSPQAEPGDVVILPTEIHQQKLSADLVLEPLAEIKEPGSWLTIFSTSNPVGFYYSTAKRIPWTLRKRSFGKISIFKVLENRRLQPDESSPAGARPSPAS